MGIGGFDKGIGEIANPPLRESFRYPRYGWFLAILGPLSLIIGDSFQIFDLDSMLFATRHGGRPLSAL
jgi:hypothetical protein